MLELFLFHSNFAPLHQGGCVAWLVFEQSVEQLFPAIAQCVRGYGHIEVGDQEMFGFVARALDYGGLTFEDDKPDTLAEALASLEKGLRKWFDEQGIALDKGE